MNICIFLFYFIYLFIFFLRFADRASQYIYLSI